MIIGFNKHDRENIQTPQRRERCPHRHHSFTDEYTGPMWASAPYEGAGVRAVEDAGPYEGVQVDDLLTKADNHNYCLAH